MGRPMCINCPNTGSLGCLGCSKHSCECERSCFKCYEYQNVQSGCFINTVPNSLTDFRIRYLCLKCNSCWKAKYDKYTLCMAYSLKHYRPEIFDDLSPSVIKELKTVNTDYWFEPRCKCGAIPIEIGEKFRPPKKTDTKAWLKIQNLSSEEKEKLFSSYCPYYVERKKESLKTIGDKPILETFDILRQRYDLYSKKDKLKRQIEKTN